MNKLRKFLHRLFPTLRIERQVITDEDESHYEDFITGFEYQAVRKMMMNRLIQRAEEAADSHESVTDLKRTQAMARRDEIKEIIMEWQNSFEDFSEEKEDANKN